jgi:multidrug transporter EmrE-like cation transporter
MGVDFRGYYASGQIALQRGFAQVYDAGVQESYLRKLPHRCPIGTVQQIPLVAMPYLPAFVLLMLPFTQLEFTTSYYVWTGLNLVLLVLYALRFQKVFGVRLNALHLLQWTICLPVISNLFLGQFNILLVVFFGEFVLSFARGRDRLAGAWLGLMLVKPHTLILLLPAVLIARRWRVLSGFIAGALVIMAISWGLGGYQGILASISLSSQFAGALIQTAPTMMNLRSLALNLQPLTSPWLAWGLALGGMLALAALTLLLWRHRFSRLPPAWILLALTTYAATCAVTWHAHFYLLMPLIPLLIYLDASGWIPLQLVAVWIFGPPLIYLVAAVISPELIRDLFGIGMLGIDLILVGWAALRLKCENFSENTQASKIVYNCE